MIAALPFLVAGAVSDWRTRSAPNWLWLCSFLASVPSTVYGGRAHFASLLALVGLTTLLTLCRVFGGADQKAIVSVGAFFPDPAMACGLVAVAFAGCVAWKFTGRHRAPFLIPWAAACGTFAVLALTTGA